MGRKKPPRSPLAIVNAFFIEVDKSSENYARLARRLGVTRQAICRYKRAFVAPPLDKFVYMADELGFDIVLLKREGQVDE